LAIAARKRRAFYHKYTFFSILSVVQPASTGIGSVIYATLAPVMTLSKFTLLALLWALLSGPASARELPVPYGREYIRAAALPAPEPRVLLSAPEAEAYRLRIKQLEWRGGPYGLDLAEGLLDAANYFESRGDLEQATTLMRRAVHVTRVNEGLYSPLQLSLLQRLFLNAMAIEDFDGADELQAWIFNVHREQYPPASRELVKASITHSHWQIRYWLLREEPGEPDELYQIWRLLNDQQPGAEELPLPLELQAELVAAQLRLLYLIGVAELGLDPDAELMLGRSYVRQQATPDATRSHIFYLRKTAFSTGKQKLGDLLARASAEGDTLLQASVAKQLGDWNLWHSNQRTAQSHYAESWEMLVQAGREPLALAWFDQPVELPADELLFPGLVKTAIDSSTRRVSASFNVSPRGRLEAGAGLSSVSLAQAEPNATAIGGRRARGDRGC
jgi:hypothetical protein